MMGSSSATPPALTYRRVARLGAKDSPYISPTFSSVSSSRSLVERLIRRQVCNDLVRACNSR
jgi:hypothetical protein